MRSKTKFNKIRNNHNNIKNRLNITIRKFRKQIRNLMNRYKRNKIDKWNNKMNQIKYSLLLN